MLVLRGGFLDQMAEDHEQDTCSLQRIDMAVAAAR
jgi:hypothetical protein